MGCKDPNTCTNEAEGPLNKMHKKFDPRDKPEPDNLSLTLERKTKNEAPRSKDGEILFDPSIPKYDEPEKHLRIFVNKEAGCRFLAYRAKRAIPGQRKLKVYTDGVCIEKPNRKKQSGGFTLALTT